MHETFVPAPLHPAGTQVPAHGGHVSLNVVVASLVASAMAPSPLPLSTIEPDDEPPLLDEPPPSVGGGVGTGSSAP